MEDMDRAPVLALAPVEPLPDWVESWDSMSWEVAEVSMSNRDDVLPDFNLGSDVGGAEASSDAVLDSEAEGFCGEEKEVGGVLGGVASKRIEEGSAARGSVVEAEAAKDERDTARRACLAAMLSAILTVDRVLLRRDGGGDGEEHKRRKRKRKKKKVENS